ncbi:amidohydrolase [Salicibibacter cibarius]|uniref:Amidohydrolase n=1 Tax=Salicibibacter cibarius TaxID=2743000 RepID=A0A7T6Z320_9BACI|nr:amidohydrolase [Salicibibacter cibarius]QQK75777.1 amidohydrolase [Salicibibacter cibarius]
MSYEKEADVILSSNAVFTGVFDKPIPASIAVTDNKITAIGSKEEIKSQAGLDTRIYDYDDQLIIPGFHDFHVHIMSGIVMENGVNLEAARSEEEAAQMVKRYADEHPNEEWIIGVGWDAGYWDGQQLPHRSSLDQVVPDRLVLLNHAEMHYAWVNSKTLEYCGINQDTEHPSYGYIQKDENGDPTGILYEKATKLVDQYAFDFSEEKERELLDKFLKLAASVGVTSVNDMYGDGNEKYYGLFNEFDEESKLTIRIHILPSIDFELEKLKQWRNEFTTDKLQFSGLKGFMDGVITSRTAYLVGPYGDSPDTCGELVYSPGEIKEKVVKADREGFRMRFHAIGDGAVRLALDAFEEAQKANGKRDARHTIEHIEIIHEDDIPRFRELGVLASMQPELMAQSERETYSTRIGPEKEPYIFPINTLKSAGVTVGLGTDFRVATLNPLLEIYRAVTRVSSDGRPWHVYECIPLAEALKDYTKSPAYGTFREEELGTLEVGKLADIVVLDRNLFEAPAEEILETKVKLTMSDGEIVYQDNDSRM